MISCGTIAALAVVLLVSLTDHGYADPSGKEKAIATSPTPPKQPMDKVEKSDAEWRAELTPEQYRVTRQAGTERANGQAYKEFKKQGEGTYYCVACGNKLFNSDTKFDSGCGWPSFYDAATAEGIKEIEDTSHGMKRVEVVCSKCMSHLGHIFRNEGRSDLPQDVRYCINGVALRFVPGDNAAPETPADK